MAEQTPESKYPEFPNLTSEVHFLYDVARHKIETGASKAELEAVLDQIRDALKAARKSIQSVSAPLASELKKQSDLEHIRASRPEQKARLKDVTRDVYLDRVAGALCGRFAGCTLGAPVELQSIETMECLAKDNGQPFPPQDYWTQCPPNPGLRYGVSPFRDYSRDRLKEVPVDDDVTYTVLGLLIAERFGTEFTTADVGQAWVDWLPVACTAEEVALRNLKNGVPAEEAADKDNPFCEWIGADIRSDPWGYLAPGNPEKAATMAYRDAYLSHRREGIYGEMYFSAAIAAAFAVDDPVEALRIGLEQIPQQCMVADAVRWALHEAPSIGNYREARKAVDARFEGMHPVHTVNNACLTVFGITIGGCDLTRVIGETVAMGLDNDCTAATAGSIVGAVVGKSHIPEHWYKPFNDTVRTYLKGFETISIPDLVERFAKQAFRS